MSGERTLVISLQGAGNLVMATPMIRSLSLSGRSVHLVAATRAVAEFMSGAPWIDSVSWPRPGPWGIASMGRLLRNERFSTSVSCYPNGRRAAFLARAVKSPERVGFPEGLPFWLRSVYSTDIAVEPGLHDVEQNLRILDALGVPRPSDATPSVVVADADREAAARLLAGAGAGPAGLVVAVHPGGAATGTFRRWPADAYAELAARIAGELDATVVLIGDASERQLLERISEGAGAGTVVAATESLGQSAAVMEKSSVVVGNDSGPLHIAAALRVPVVGIYGPTDESRTAPYGGGHVVLTADIRCRPCYEFGAAFSCRHETLRCLELVSVNDVFDAVRKRLAAGATGS
ncbi:MAG: glycosyltransferase family 9 protein [Candidatus Eisenbacteria bacterium]